MTAFSLKRIVASLEARKLLVSASADLPRAIQAITDDSRRVAAGDLFVAVKGSDVDGHQFLPQARERGAAAAIVETEGSTSLPTLVVRDSREAAAVAAATFYRFPSRELRMVGVTGTNGKTTTVNLLRHLLGLSERRAASIGTLGVLVGGGAGNERGSSSDVAPGGGGGSNLTTPGAIELQRTLRGLLKSGVRSVAMEVSSHSLDQRRVDAIEFDAAVFTNVSRDHIDYHHSMEAYFAAKARLCELLGEDGVAVVNSDDAQWRALPRCGSRRVTYGVESGAADVRAVDIQYFGDGEGGGGAAPGSSWRLVIGSDSHAVRLPLIGAFNVSNALAAAAVAWALGMSPATIAALLASVPQVPGRMERLNDSPVVLRDYAHTPDALERAILAVKPFAPKGVAVVFGCGGDRDKGKRPQMGEIAARLADRVIITSDNPRTENPETILDEIAAGIGKKPFERIEDRRAAIARAIAVASESGELVLLAGKGHETYQIRGKERLPFDEKEIVEEIVRTGQ